MKKLKYIVMAILIILISIFTSLGAYIINQVTYAFAKDVDLSNIKIDGLVLGDKLENVILEQNQNSNDNWYKTIEGNQVRVNKSNRIIEIVINNSATKIHFDKTQTLTLKDKKEEIKQVLGNSYYKKYDNQGFSINGYRDKTKNKEIEFWYLNDDLDHVSVKKAE